MSKGVIGVDIDLTVVDIGTAWNRWLRNITRTDKLLPSTPNYDISSYYKEELELIGRQGLDFFRQTGLYDLLHPINYSEEVLGKYHKLGYDIVFISAIKGGHSKSKAEFIKRFFPFYSGMIFTKEKQFVNCKVFIDDRHDMLNKVDADLKIKYNTPYTQAVPLNEGVYTARCWMEVERLLQSKL